MQESNSENFNHLKIHTQFSICEGAIKIDDLKSFLTEITSRYFEVTNDYHKQYSEMQTKRRTAKLVEPA